MLVKHQAAAKRYSGVHPAIDHWLAERNQLLVGYFQLAGLSPYERDSHALPDCAAVADFCALLMDYVSAGHFEIYQHIIQRSQSAAAVTQALADEIFPQLAESTEVALDFNDRFADCNEQEQLTGFDRAISELGEALAQRIDLEDQLLAMLHEHELLP